MTWIIVAIALMIISFTADVMMREHCEHDWEEQDNGGVRCTKCKERSRLKSNMKLRSEA